MNQKIFNAKINIGKVIVLPEHAGYTNGKLGFVVGLQNPSAPHV